MVKGQKYHILYKTTCKVTGNFYIGVHSTENIEDEYLGSGKRLRYSIQKHGKENHVREILETFNSREELAKREKEIVNEELLKKEECMNLAIGGEGGFLNREAAAAGARGMNAKMWSDPDFIERKRKQVKIMSLPAVREKSKQTCLKRTGSANGLKGKTQTESWRKMISENNRIAQKGERNSQFGTVWITNDTESKKIRKEQLSDFISLGWKSGRKMI